MKNTLLISLVTILGFFAGGYYLYSNDELDSLVEYLPEPIAGFITSNLPPKNNLEVTDTNTATATATENTAVFQAVEAEAGPDEEVVPLNNTPAEIQAGKANSEMNQQAQQLQQQALSEADAIAEAPKSKVEEVVANTNNKQPVSVSTSNTIKSSDEVLELESQIEKIKKTIGQLDGENLALKEHFQEILRKNRMLALKLKEIDKQLKVSSE